MCAAGIPMEEDKDEQATSIRGRLLMLVNRIKGQTSRADKPAEKEQAAPCKETSRHICCMIYNVAPW